MVRLVASAMTVIWTVIAVTLSTGDALAERRVALVIGNSHYKNDSLALANPKNDAQDVSAALAELGFEVITATDATKRDVDLALQKFARVASEADSALFYYAGHALQYEGRNYLMPTDAELEDDISLRYQTVSTDEVREALDRANGVKIMVLDACRNNPLADRFRRTVSGRTRDVGMLRGLARIDKTQGVVVAYAAAADQVALDGNGRNSPFTTAFLKRVREPGLEIEMMFRRIASDVNALTNGRQRPETSISLLSEYYLNQMDRTTWERVRDSGDVAALRDFVARFPSSPLLPLAEKRLNDLERYARERQLEKEKAEREAARQREEADWRAKLAATERERTEREAAQRQREEDEQRNKVAALEREKAAQEAARQRAEEERRAKLAAEQERAAREAAQRQREEDDKRAKLAQEEREKAQREAAQRQREEEEQRAKLTAAEQERAAREAAQRQRDEEEKRAKIAKEQQEKAQREAAQRQREEDEKRAKLAAADQERLAREAAQRQRDEEAQRVKLAALEREKTEREAARQRAEEEQRAKIATAERERAEKARVCKSEDEKLALLQAAGADARDEMVKFEKGLACAQLRPYVLAALSKLPVPVPAPAPPPAAPQTAVAPEPPVNTPQLVATAQGELRRIGCFAGTASGRVDDATRKALKDYLSTSGQSADQVDITEKLILELKGQEDRVCPLECSKGQIADGERCIAAPKENKTPPVATRPPPAKPAPVARKPAPEPRRATAPEAPPRARTEAKVPPPARPSQPIMGVGF